MDKPLTGIKVVDLSTFVAAPVTARLLADLGAEVVKIEPPNGDTWRLTGINYVPTRFSQDENPVFDIYNTGKKMISINMKTPEGQEIFHKLLSQADVFVTNNRDQALERLHITYEELKERYPRLIYAQVTGFGPKGPKAGMPAFDTTAFWSQTGFMRDMAVVGEDGAYNPTYPPSGVGDSVTAYFLLSEINAALYQREKTGKGQRVEASLFHVGVFTMGTMQITNQRPWGRQYPTKRANLACPGGYYKCKDGEYLFIAAGMVTKLMDQLSRAIGRPELQYDPRFATPEARVENREELYAIMKDAFAKKTVDEWLEVAKELDFAAVRYQSFSDLAEDEQALANGYIEHVTFRNGRVDAMPASPFHMDTVTDLKTVPAPLLGGDTVEVLQDLGYSEEEIQDMLTRGIAKKSE